MIVDLMRLKIIYMRKDNGYLGKWSMGNIALFGAILMSKGIVGKEKEELKKMMYEALTPKN